MRNRLQEQKNILFVKYDSFRNIVKTLYWISSYYILPLPLGLFCCVFLCNLLVEGENNCYTQTGRTPCSRLFYFHYRNHKPYPLMIAPLHLEKLQIQTRRSFLLFWRALLARMGCDEEKFYCSGYIIEYLFFATY